MKILSNFRKVFSCYLFVSLALLVLGVFSFASISSADMIFNSQEHYKLSAEFSNDANNKVNFNWTMDSNAYLYKNRINIKVLSPSSLKLKSIIYPEAIQKIDPAIGTYSVYSNSLNLPVTFNTIPNGSAKLLVNYQGCSSLGFCYPPKEQVVNLNFANHTVSVGSASQSNLPLANIGSKDILHHIPIKEVNKIALDSKINYSQQIFSHSILVAILICFALGFLLAFTPCILPMIPILSAIILGQKDIKTSKSFGLSLTYVLAMALTYTALGVLVSFLGYNFQGQLQSPVFLIGLAALFVILSLGLLGVFNTKLLAPISKVFNKASMRLNSKVKGGGYISVFLMGIVATLIVSPCVTPPLVGVLAYISQSGNLLLGGSALFALGLGMGLPLLIVGTFGSCYLPKSGKWMLWVKWFFAGLLILVAASLVWRAAPNLISSNKADKSGYIIKSQSKLNSILAMAKKEHKPVMIDFYANWCLSCKIMEKETFSNSKVKKLLQNFVVVRVDMTKFTPEIKSLQKLYGVVAPPTIIFYGKAGNLLSNSTVVGETKASAFESVLMSIN